MVDVVAEDDISNGCQKAAVCSAATIAMLRIYFDTKHQISLGFTKE